MDVRRAWRYVEEFIARFGITKEGEPLDKKYGGTTRIYRDHSKVVIASVQGGWSFEFVPAELYEDVLKRLGDLPADEDDDADEEPEAEPEADEDEAED
jgi:hypothetical protein